MRNYVATSLSDFYKLLEGMDLTDTVPVLPITQIDPKYIEKVKKMLKLLKGEIKIIDNTSNFSKSYDKLKNFSKNNNILKKDIIDFLENELIIKNIDNHDKEKGINLQYHFLRKNEKFMSLFNDVFKIDYKKAEVGYPTEKIFDERKSEEENIDKIKKIFNVGANSLTIKDNQFSTPVLLYGFFKHQKFIKRILKNKKQEYINKVEELNKFFFNKYGYNFNLNKISIESNIKGYSDDETTIEIPLEKI